MPMLIPIQYHKRKYPKHITPEIDEIAAHFDISMINVKRRFSLHTEYSYAKRRLSSELLKKFSTIKNAHKNNIPMLWYSEKWATEFAYFIKCLCNGNEPDLIEIHPPFSDYIENISNFLSRYKIFEEKILSYYSNCKILVENRYGSIYKGGKFILSKGNELRELCEHIERMNLKLRLALDIPQLLSAYGGPEKLKPEKLQNILQRNNSLSSFTESIHLWGKRKNANGRNIAHCGNLDSYFVDHSKKEIFLDWIITFLSDGKPRFFVPEVNSSDEDLASIINDLEKSGITFN
ncbi:hypothetical protein [Deferribacter abyssi]|uniref:hypothetical protein n=1 Tax=Deferribacter abyssi TaxID=213806 RepID=UPI003C284E46